ncbi:hypothetical protein LIER_29416 [Lithospermum erythrorhizon]|uniref:rRNA-processing protein FYV7 n=1 Tax=Lithospermum erythrorhizon TaxID=34254 RepID=A0AAV3RMN1_LITER
MVKITIGSENEVNANNINRNSMNNKQIMKKNMQRIGGRALSLNAFANAKTFNKDYNPSIIKKKKEFYRNAKFIKKYKKSVKQQEHQLDNVGTSMNQHEKQNNPAMGDSFEENGNETGNAYKFNKKTKGREKNSAFSLKEVYRKKCEEEEKARMEREALIQEKKEGKQKAEARRKDLREKMFKKTGKGQPVMKYRIEHLLETIQHSSN